MWTNTARTIDVRAALQGLSPKGLLTAGTVVLTALLAVQTGRLIWIVAVPPGGVGVAAAAEASPVRDADLSILSRFDAFYLGEPAGEPLVQTSAPETTGGSFQLFGVRVFRMAPLHHHFEQKGWPESTVVIRFWIIAVVLALAGLATLKLR